MQRALNFLFFCPLPLAIFGCLIPLTAVAQITVDGTTSTTVNQNAHDFTIDNGDRVGDNLFHSFDEFSVPKMGSAAFNNASDIANIFSRVTGSNISDIDGLLSANGTANLFLINPNGIIFGPNARLNLGGSFFASTADSLLFEGNTEFSASNPQAAPLLKISVPIGLHLPDNPGKIVNRSTVKNSAGNTVGLEVAPGKNFTLVGGNINFNAGNTTASGGNIELGGLSEAGTVTFNNDGSLNFPKNVAKADITITNFSRITNEIFGTEDAGSITIDATNGGAFNLSDSLINTTTLGEGNAGDIALSADSVKITDSFILTETFGTGDAGSITIEVTNGGAFNLSNSVLTTTTSGTGNAGDLAISADSVKIAASSLSTETFGTGDAGSITIDATNSGVFNLSDSVLTTTASGEGNAGDLKIRADSVKIADSSIRTETSKTEITGNAGNITIDMTNGGAFNLSASNISTRTFSEGKGGNFKISAGSVDITDLSLITTDTSGTGDAGIITIEVTNGGAFNLSNTFITTSTSGTGKAGDLAISAGSVKITERSQISTNSFITPETSRTGDAGIITIEVTNGGAFNLSDSIITTDTSGTGNAGDVTITTDSLTLTKGGKVSATTFGRGSGGNIGVEANFIELNRGTIEAETAFGEGGNIQLQIDDNLTLRNNSLISAQAFEAAHGGNINIIDAEFIIAFPSKGNGNDIIATAARGNGGNITINAKQIFNLQKGRAIDNKGNFIPNNRNDIDASSQAEGLDGTIIFNSPDVDPASGIFQLPDIPIDAEAILAQDLCKFEDEKIAKGSSFIITGRGGLTPTSQDPLENLDRVVRWANRDDLQVSKNGLVGVRQPSQGDSSEISYPVIQQSQGWIKTSDGSIWLVANSPDKNLQNSGIVHPSCRALQHEAR